MVCKVNVFLLMCKLFWQKIGETYWRPLDLKIKSASFNKNRAFDVIDKNTFFK